MGHLLPRSSNQYGMLRWPSWDYFWQIALPRKTLFSPAGWLAWTKPFRDVAWLLTGAATFIPSVIQDLSFSSPLTAVFFLGAGTSTSLCLAPKAEGSAGTLVSRFPSHTSGLLIRDSGGGLGRELGDRVKSLLGWDCVSCGRRGMAWVGEVAEPLRAVSCKHATSLEAPSAGDKPPSDTACVVPMPGRFWEREKRWGIEGERHHLGFSDSKSN